MRGMTSTTNVLIPISTTCAVTCWWGLRDQFSLMAGSQKSFTSLSMVVMRVDPNCFVSVGTRFPCSSVTYSPSPMLKLKAKRESRKTQRRFIYLYGVWNIVKSHTFAQFAVWSRYTFVSHLMKSFCVILVFWTWSGMYCCSSCWHSFCFRSGSELNLTGMLAWAPTAHVHLDGLNHMYIHTHTSQFSYLPGTVCQCPLSLQLAMLSGTCTPAAPPYPQCKVCSDQCSRVSPGEPVLVPPAGSASKPPPEPLCGHVMEPSHFCGRKNGSGLEKCEKHM